QGFDRTMDVALDDDLELLHLSGLDGRVEVGQSDLFDVLGLFLLLELLALLGEVLGVALALGDLERIARPRDSVETKHLDRHGRTGFFDRSAVVVKHRSDLAGEHAADEVVADLERALLNKHRGDDTAALVNLRLDDLALGTALAAGLELHHLGLEENGV